MKAKSILISVGIIVIFGILQFVLDKYYLLDNNEPLVYEDRLIQYQYSPAVPLDRIDSLTISCLDFYIPSEARHLKSIVDCKGLMKILNYSRAWMSANDTVQVGECFDGYSGRSSWRLVASKREAELIMGEEEPKVSEGFDGLKCIKKRNRIGIDYFMVPSLMLEYIVKDNCIVEISVHYDFVRPLKDHVDLKE